jgi:hypothetical protein
VLVPRGAAKPVRLVTPRRDRDRHTLLCGLAATRQRGQSNSARPPGPSTVWSTYGNKLRWIEYRILQGGLQVGGRPPTASHTTPAIWRGPSFTSSNYQRKNEEKHEINVDRSNIVNGNGTGNHKPLCINAKGATFRHRQASSSIMTTL